MVRSRRSRVLACAMLLAAAVGLVVLVLRRRRCGAWGMDVHRCHHAARRRGPAGRTCGRSSPRRADFISEHAADPDLWRVVGSARASWATRIRITSSTSTPRRAGAVHERAARLGRVRRAVRRRPRDEGRTPAVARRGDLQRGWSTAFQDIGKRDRRRYAADNARYLVGGALALRRRRARAVPRDRRTTTAQLTNQRGIHARFETELVLRNLSTLTLAPVTVTPIPNMRDVHLRDARRQPGARRRRPRGRSRRRRRPRGLRRRVLRRVLHRRARGARAAHESMRRARVASVIVARVGRRAASPRCPSTARAPPARPSLATAAAWTCISCPSSPTATSSTASRGPRAGARRSVADPDHPRKGTAIYRRALAEGEEARRHAGSAPPHPHRGRVRRWMTRVSRKPWPSSGCSGTCARESAAELVYPDAAQRIAARGEVASGVSALRPRQAPAAGA